MAQILYIYIQMRLLFVIVSVIQSGEAFRSVLDVSCPWV